MPTWSNKLPPVGKHQGYDLRRTPTSGSLHAIITCETLHVCDTHFWHGRTTPCERLVNEAGKTIDDSHCPGCLDKQAWRTHAYVSAFDAKSHEHFIFECTAIAAKPLEDYFQAASTLRGCIIHADRPKGHKNAKVVIVTGTANPQKITLPTPPDVIRALAVIWRLPASALPIAPTEPGAPTIRPNHNRLKQMREQPDNAMNPLPMSEILKQNGHKPKQEVVA